MVKYCQECGNASYDSAPICGNCGAKFPPKSEANSKPPIFEKIEKKEAKKSESSFSKNMNNVKNNFSKKLNDIDLGFGEEIKEEPKKSEKYENKSIVGFKEKTQSTKDPAKKFETPIKETKKTKETEEEVPKKIIKVQKENKNSNIDSKIISKKSITLIAIVVIILIAIVGTSIITMNNNTNAQQRYYSDGAMSLYYPGNWSMYNNTDDLNGGGEIAFKTPENVLIGYTTIISDTIDLNTVTNQINQTAMSLGGSIINYNNITVDGINATDITISSIDHGYSRYISIIHNGIYYSFIINNGKTKDINDLTSLRSPDIENMIGSIKFMDSPLNTTESPY